MIAINVSDRVYDKIHGMAEREGIAVNVLVEQWVTGLAPLDERRRELVLRYARLLANDDASQWAEIIETVLDRAEMS